MTQLNERPMRRRTEPAGREEFAILSSLAQELAGEFRLQPLLEKIVTSAVSLVGCSSGSICTIDEAAQRYRKEVDLAVVCRAGSEFPLDEGVTGAVLRAGGTVVFADYADVPGGHIATADPRYHRSVLGVPIVLQGTIIGALIVFADDDDQAFSGADRALLELFATHAAIAIANSRLHTHAAEHAKAAAIATERERMLSDVHDTVGRAVAGVMLHLGDAADRAGRGTDPREAIVRAQQAAVTALDYGSAAQGGGRPLLGHEGLEPRISRELDWLASIARLRTQLRVVGEPHPVSGEIAQQMLHIVREALTNVVKHASAGHVSLVITATESLVTLEITDDGAGAPEVKRRSGLANLQQRALRRGGTFSFDSKAGQTRVLWSVPVDEPSEKVSGEARQ